MKLYNEISRLERERNYADLCELIDNITEKEIKEVRKILPELLEHSSWIVRVAALELVGYFRLREFLPYVNKSIDYRIVAVRSFALFAYYLLERDKALSLLKSKSRSSNVKIKCKSLALLFVETRNNMYLDKIKKILKRKNCDPVNQYAVLSTFEYFLDIKTFPEVVELFKYVIKNSPNRAVVEDFRNGLKGY